MSAFKCLFSTKFNLPMSQSMPIPMPDNFYLVLTVIPRTYNHAFNEYRFSSERLLPRFSKMFHISSFLLEEIIKIAKKNDF